MIKKISYIFVAVILVAITCFSLGQIGVRAEWRYAGASPQSIRIDVVTAVMPWEGSTELPNDSSAGDSHVALVTAILSGEYVVDGNKVNLGLNTENSYLAEQIAERKGIWWRDSDMLGSMDIWEDENIENYFNLNEATNNVAFILEFPDGSDDTYYLYTTSVDLGARRSPNIPIGTNVYPVYRTTLKLNEEGEWVATITETGYAKSAYYSNPILGLAVDPAFDTSSWTAGELGTTKGTAIYAFVGQTVDVRAKDENVSTFYQVSSSSTKVLTVKVADEDSSVVYVTTSNGNQVKASSGAQGSKTISFSASRNTYYYIEIVGDKTCSFTIS